MTSVQKQHSIYWQRYIKLVFSIHSFCCLVCDVTANGLLQYTSLLRRTAIFLRLFHATVWLPCRTFICFSVWTFCCFAFIQTDSLLGIMVQKGILVIYFENNVLLNCCNFVLYNNVLKRCPKSVWLAQERLFILRSGSRSVFTLSASPMCVIVEVIETTIYVTSIQVFVVHSNNWQLLLRLKSSNTRC